MALQKQNPKDSAIAGISETGSCNSESQLVQGHHLLDVNERQNPLEIGSSEDTDYIIR